MQKLFRYLELFRLDECDGQTDRRTDGQTRSSPCRLHGQKLGEWWARMQTLIIILSVRVRSTSWES